MKKATDARTESPRGSTTWRSQHRHCQSPRRTGSRRVSQARASAPVIRKSKTANCFVHTVFSQVRLPAEPAHDSQSCNNPYRSVRKHVREAIKKSWFVGACRCGHPFSCSCCIFPDGRPCVRLKCRQRDILRGRLRSAESAETRNILQLLWNKVECSVSDSDIRAPELPWGGITDHCSSKILSKLDVPLKLFYKPHFTKFPI